jgi:hypothetical protein
MIQTWILLSNGLSLSLLRNVLNLCLYGWKGLVGVIRTIRTLCYCINGVSWSQYVYVPWESIAKSGLQIIIQIINILI